MYLRSSKEDYNFVNKTKEAFFSIFNRLVKEAQTSSVENLHDIVQDNPNRIMPNTENLLSGQRILDKSTTRVPGAPRELNTSLPDRHRKFDGEVGQQGDGSVSKTKKNDIGDEASHGKDGGPEITNTFGGEAQEMSDIAGGQNAFKNQDAEQRMPSNADSLGPDSAKTTEGQFGRETGVPEYKKPFGKARIQKGVPPPSPPSPFTPKVQRKKNRK